MPSDDELAGVPCYGGLDLGQSDDFSAWARLWVLTDGRVAVKMRFWVPESALMKFPSRPYGEWKRSGALTITEGDTTDYGEIQETIAADCVEDGVREVGYDNRFAEQMAQNLTGQGVVMVNTGQGFQLNMAVKRMLELIVNGQLCHGDNPILSWMASNFVVRHGRLQEIRPDKEKTPDKIDGIVALDMAIDRGIIRQPLVPPSVYLERGVRTLGA
jgi:phage terminase large subunit-like protein